MLSHRIDVRNWLFLQTAIGSVQSCRCDFLLLPRLAFLLLPAVFVNRTVRNRVEAIYRTNVHFCSRNCHIGIEDGSL